MSISNHINKLTKLRNNVLTWNDNIAYMKLKSKLPALMSKKGVDQKTVAIATGLSPTTVSKFYRNQLDRFDRRTVTTLCEYFGCKKLDDLIELCEGNDDD
jgi:DNA-binding Xre family transcriptional regulator